MAYYGIGEKDVVDCLTAFADGVYLGVRGNVRSQHNRVVRLGDDSVTNRNSTAKRALAFGQTTLAGLNGPLH